MARVQQFSAPAHLNDFDAIHRAAWSEFMSATFDEAIQCVEQPQRCQRSGLGVGAGRSQFYNPSRTDTDGSEAAQPVIWDGFPQILTRLLGDGAFDVGDAPVPFGGKSEGVDDAGLPTTAFTSADGTDLGLHYRQQDEYLEWHVERDASSTITRITFTCEGPEYWQALAQGYPSFYQGPRHAGATGDVPTLLRLYNQLLGRPVDPEDLFFQADVLQGGRVAFRQGDYNPYNRWNTTDGLIHLTHPANTLGAEIHLGADASVPRGSPGALVKDTDQLICCAGYGEVNRFSDPSIGALVNGFARDGRFVTLRDPVGLYIDSIDTATFAKPDGSPVGNYFTPVRQDLSPESDPADLPRIVRAVYEVPAGEKRTDGGPLRVGDLIVDQKKVRSGGQIAAHVKMKLIGVAFGRVPFTNAPLPCTQKCCRRTDRPKVLVPVGLGKSWPKIQPSGSLVEAFGTAQPTPMLAAMGRRRALRPLL